MVMVCTPRKVQDELSTPVAWIFDRPAGYRRSQRGDDSEVSRMGEFLLNALEAMKR